MDSKKRKGGAEKVRESKKKTRKCVKLNQHHSKGLTSAAALEDSRAVENVAGAGGDRSAVGAESSVSEVVAGISAARDPRRPRTSAEGKDTSDTEQRVKIAELSKSSVCMKEPERVNEILTSMRNSGSSTLQVISDFDMTLTRFAYNGKRCPTCHNILENDKLISEECQAELQNLLDTYYPIEIDCTRSPEEKLPLMVEWWTKAHDLLVQQKIKKADLALVVRESEARLRDGYKEFFKHLNDTCVPLLIFSAGIGDVLEEVIRQADVFFSNVKVVSNYMDFDESGVLRAFKGQLIHIYNKREGALLNTQHFQELHSRSNVLLLGDSLGDLNMSDGVSDLQNILTIGYLNDKVDERRQSYLNSYDVVLVKDESMEVPNAILRYITGH
ncbi:7-methylguanosine phosphate-specific 5'-nucleotidase [Triplophysa tibetana]|uniref:5'-nucleotidase n=1 Tax=Triplophysa tibetana TaxID=1572043 RepID=A0A5A9NPE8_9TELE|nr:7-methylguanosine phosphate-specific 5'-nucleotidase [Triplophysa tibetana]